MFVGWLNLNCWHVGNACAEPRMWVAAFVDGGDCMRSVLYGREQAE